MRGTLHLVVGPSGVGKDTLIAAARAVRPDLIVPTRMVTRPAGPGEDHEPVSEGESARPAWAPSPCTGAPTASPTASPEASRRRSPPAGT